MPSPESVFEFLFKFRRSVFEAGEIGLGAGASAYVVVLLAAAALLSFWSYARLNAEKRLGRMELVLLIGLRTLALLFLGVSLLEPTLRVLTVAPQQTFVGVLIDDSSSLTIKDDRGRARAEFVRERLLDPAGDIRRALEQKFKVRFFKFSDSARRMQGEALNFAGTQTNLAAALRRAREELADVPVSGLVLVSDGADNVAGPLSETLLDLKTRQLPVFAVGLGQEHFDRDVEITRIEVPAAVLQGSSVVASLAIKATGTAREPPISLTVEDSSRVLSAQEVQVTSADSSTVRVTIRADEPGPRLLRFKVAPIPGEQVTENNQFDVALDVLGRREKILYFEGAARYEAKFLRRAVQDDRNLQVVTLERTADNKFLRLDVDDAEELVAGFPRTREELFGYRGLVVGGVEASFFTVDQIRMLSEFVSQRGGGLLMIGSEKTFAEGGYAGTAVAEALPVALDAADVSPAAAAGDARPGGDRFQWLKVSVTPLGAAQPVTQLAANEADNEARFKALPQLSSINHVTRVKPGASALLTGEAEGASNEGRVVLAFQRYGRGRAFAFPVQDSWRWQMHADVAVDDTSHETFWRQMLRQLVNGVPGPVALSVSAGLVSPGTTVTLRVDVSDETFIRVNDAAVTALIQKPNGDVKETVLHWTVDKDGEYSGEFQTEERGVYEVRVAARRAGKLLGEDTAHIRVDDLKGEFRGAEMRGDLMRRVAAETGGRFYTPATAAQLTEDLTYSPKTASVVDEKELWDMPALFLGILVCLSLEWLYRKRRGLA